LGRYVIALYFIQAENAITLGLLAAKEIIFMKNYSL